MNRLRTSASLVTAAALAATCTGLTAANAANAAPKTHTLRFTLRTLADNQKANKLTETERVLMAGKTAGFSISDCVFNFAIAQATCDAAVALPGGVIYARIKVNGQTGASSGAVTGGTRAYAGAKGTTTGKPGSRPSDTLITVVYHT